jgi:hypothetical protein
MTGLFTVPPGQSVTLNENVDTTYRQLFHLPDPPPGVARGKVLMPNQRGKLTMEMFGAKDYTQSVNTEVALSSAHDALPNGGRIELGNCHYICDGPVVPFTNRVNLEGAGWGHNPQPGGSYFHVTPAFAHTEQALITIIAGSCKLSDFMVGGYTHDKLNAYTGIKLAHDIHGHQPGKSLLSNLAFDGIGIGVDFGVGNQCNDYNLHVANFRKAGLRYGGVMGKNFGPCRSVHPTVNNGGFTAWTTAATDDHDLVLINDAANAIIGDEITFDGEAILEIIGIVGNLVQVSAPVTVPCNAIVRFAAHLVGTCFEFLGNAADVWLVFPEAAGGRHILHGKGGDGPGWRIPEAITVTQANFTVSCRETVLLERMWYLEGDGHFGDAVWSSAVRLAGIDSNGNPDPSAVEGVNLEGANIAGAGDRGIDADCYTNLVAGNAHSNNLSGGGYSNIHRGAGARGEFRAVGRNLANGLLNGSQGMASCSITTDPSADVIDVIEHNVTVPTP